MMHAPDLTQNGGKVNVPFIVPVSALFASLNTGVLTKVRVPAVLSTVIPQSEQSGKGGKLDTTQIIADAEVPTQNLVPLSEVPLIETRSEVSNPPAR